MGDKSIASIMVQDMLRVCGELGRTPGRDEFTRLTKHTKRGINAVFGSYTELMTCAGRHKKKNRPDKQEIRERVFEKLKQDVAVKRPEPPKITKSLLCISDMHHPYGHPDIVPFLSALHAKYKFDTILIGGDEIDAHAMSFHTHDPDLLSPGHELEAAINAIKPLYALFPEALVLSSNHGDLFYRKGKHHGFPRHVLKGYNEILEAPIGWQWKEEYVFQFPNGHKAIAHHGYSSNILMASKKRAMSLIQFHFHSSFSIQFWQNRESMFFALQCGCMVDDKSLALEYNRLTIERPIVGVGAVLDGQPRLFPMILDKNGRWNGVIS